MLKNAFDLKMQQLEAHMEEANKTMQDQRDTMKDQEAALKDQEPVLKHIVDILQQLQQRNINLEEMLAKQDSWRDFKLFTQDPKGMFFSCF